MNEEEKIFNGKLFFPGDPELKKIKMKAHNLSFKYNSLLEDETEERNKIIKDLFCCIGDNFFIQGPIYIHYGTHTKIGKNFFANFNLTIQDDANVTIGDNCNFGTGTTIVTPLHPMLADERNKITTENGEQKRLCWAKPVKIGNNCWFGANVTVLPGVTIGDNCVIGAGSVVTKDIPPNTFGAGVPCRIIRELTQKDSVTNMPEILGNCTV